MGLDNYWMKLEPVYIGKEYKLCGGIFSGHGDGSFRGKVYNKFIEDMTEYSLYDELDQDDIKQIAEKLNKLKYNKRWEEEYSIKKREFESLKEMFNDYSQIDGIKLIPWA